MIDTIGGQTQIYCTGMTAALPQVKAGKVRALGVTTLKRSPAAPEIPTIAEQGFPGFDVSSWFGIMVPAKTPQPIVRRLHADIAKALESAELKGFIASQGSEPALMDPTAFGEFLRAELAKWGKVVKEAKLKLD